MNKNQENIKVISGLLAILIGIIVLYGWYIWHASNNTKTALNEAGSVMNPQSAVNSNIKTTFNTTKTRKIKNFNLASYSLKKALIASYYDNAKKSCDQENANVSTNAQIKWVIDVQKIVRDDFAKVQFCGSGGSSIMAHVKASWQVVGSLAMAPSCKTVDQYKISKEITSTCYVDDTGATREVTYL